jgi:hypothetical protein
MEGSCKWRLCGFVDAARILLVVVLPLITAGCEGFRLTGLRPTTPTITLRAEPATIERGQFTTLRWTSQNATYIGIDPAVGGVYRELVGTPTIGSPSGSQSVQPVATVTYTATAWNAGATSFVSVVVTVNQPTEASGTLNLSYRFNLGPLGAPPVNAAVRFQGRLERATGSTGAAEFDQAANASVIADVRGTAQVSTRVSGLRLGTWRILATPQLPGSGPQTCSVLVPGILTLSVASGEPACYSF